MSDAFRTQQTIIRAELREVFGNRPRLIKAFENLLFDMAVTVPDALTGNASDADDATTSAQALAVRADGVAQQALAAATTANDGPPVMVLAQSLVADDLPPAPAPIPPADPFDDWPAVVYPLVARVARLEAELANFKDGPTP
jgi:hypothetical protein